MAYTKYASSTISPKRNEYKRRREEVSSRSSPYWSEQYMYDESMTQDEQKSLDYDDVTSPQYKRHASHNDLCWRQPDGKENCDSEYSHVSFSKNTSVCPLPPDLSIEKEPVDISRISIGPIPQENTRKLRSSNNDTNFFSQVRPCHEDRTNLYPQTPRCADPDESPNSSMSHKGEEFKSNEICDETLNLSQGLTGLDNLGNTCFMNSALQCLVHAQTVCAYFAGGTYEQDILEKSPMGGQLAENFAKVCGGIYQQPSFSSVNPSVLKDVISRWAPQFTGFNQQDAHELLRFLLDGLSEDLKRIGENCQHRVPKILDGDLSKMTPEEQGEYWWDRHLSMNSSFITDEFCGQLMSTIECLGCHQQRYCFDPMYDLSLPMPGDAQHMSIFGRRTFRRSSSRFGSESINDDDCSLNDCLKMFMKEEVLDGQNMSYCAKCKKLQKTHKRLNLNRLPNMLVLHLKRFGNSRRKKQNKISYPMNGLDLRPFLSKNTRTRASRKGPLYDLHAVCHHIGTSYSGHYTASCFDRSSKEWYEFNDTKVSRHDDKLSPCNTPYMLFYKLRQ
eukprot:CAMPEP_0197836920 /NCGR_PEP_ID=MMETSP1437-20131217/30469_1 /TAXON_ID=49252 ORGANISM="Eucampia antarctica, Strain CCMP1452" /NCGR_SAMPLE_ID=MMETSP1437 /ASSEMBLY_ACC=CAM_ASM_001096 /LENGTH=558 /DNA_ID=CAMNT_0043443495 /DNA_START=320 /DNA_END=1996 /DNA_ORIENTATION=-